MKTFYMNAIRNAKNYNQRLNVMIAAAKCQSLSAEDYYDVLGVNRERL